MRCTAASVDFVDTSTDFRLRIRNLRPVVARLQDRTIRQLKEEAQHLSRLGVRHVLDGLVLASLWRLCILCDTVLVFVCLAVPSAIDLLGVCYWLQQLTGVEEEHAQGICMACNARFCFLFVVV